MKLKQELARHENRIATATGTFKTAFPEKKLIALLFLGLTSISFAQVPEPSPTPDPASEPAVLAVAKVLPAVVNINTERIVRREVRDPFDDFTSQFFGTYRSRPREIRQRLQSLGSGFIVDPAGLHCNQRACGGARGRSQD